MEEAYLKQIQSLPRNFDAFTVEIASELQKLYGVKASAEYASHATHRFEETINHSQVFTLGAMEGEICTALSVAILRDDIGQIIFTHVLKPYTGRGIEHALFRHVVAALRDAGVAGIVCEFLPMCAMDLAPMEDAEGFTRVPRLMMQRALRGTEFSPSGQTREMRPEDYKEVAQVLVDAYADHPGRAYHAEVQTTDRAKSFVTAAAHGGFGTSNPTFLRVAEDAGTLTGIMLGCHAAPDVGFVLHVAVRPSYRNHGVGALLMKDTMAAFEAAGMVGAALGVTETNPARHLYERLGYATTKQFHTSVWWRDTQ